VPPRVFSFLAYLIVNRDRRLTRAAVAAALWPDELEEDARSNVRRHLHRLNAELPKSGGAPWVSTTNTTVQWNPQADAWIDVVEFGRLATSEETAAAAAALYDGDFMAGHFDDWIVAERERLLATFLDVAYSLAIRARANRDFVQACEYADRMLALGEWREDALRVKMSSLYELGDRPGALAAYDAFCKQLHDDMGVDAMPETRGLRETILANLPLASEPAPSTTVRAALPIHGRSDELERLLASWQVAARRTGTTIFVGGEAGVGKSRLLSEFAQSVELQGGHALVGHAREGEGAPYQPLVDVVRAAAPYLVRDELPDVWLSALAPLVPELLRLHPDLPEIPSIEGGRQRLHEAFARVLESLARRRPVAVILEDLHWANVDTLDAFEHLARRAGSSHILLVASYRTEEASSEHPLRGLRRHLQHEHRASVVGLGPLDRAAIEELVAGAAPNADDPSGLADAIYRSSEGNPLFAWQLLQTFLETGTFSSESVAVDQAIAARAARLDPDTRRVLDVASLVGDRFSVEEIAEIGAWDESDVFAAVDSLLDLRLFRYASAPGLDLSFAHHLIRDAIAAQVPQHGRPGLHRRIAAVLQRTRDADAGLVAAHHALGGNREAAYAAYLYAARTAHTIFAHGDASEFAARAAEFAGDDRERFDALILLLDAYHLDPVNPSVVEAVAGIADAAARLGDDERFEALLRRCRYLDAAALRVEQGVATQALFAAAAISGRDAHRMHALHEIARYEALQGRLHNAVPLLERALEAAPPDERPTTVRCLALLTSALARLGDLEGGTRALERGRAIVREYPDPQTASDLLTADLGMALVLEDEAGYHRVGEEYLEINTKVGSISGTALALTALGQSAHMRGDVTEARKRYAEARDIQKRHGLKQNLLANTINSGLLERELGNFDAALALWDVALPIAERLTSKSSIACCEINSGEALLARGDVATAIPHLERALELCREMGELRLLCDTTIALGCARARSGDLEGGLAMMREAIATRREIKAARTLPNDFCYLIEELLAAGRLDEAVAAAAELRRLYEDAPDKQMFPTRILATLAAVARAGGDPAAAEQFLAEGKRRFDARIAELPDSETRAAYAALDFNRTYAPR
jgi:DNA-binding SARP family transcriptional activator